MPRNDRGRPGEGRPQSVTAGDKAILDRLVLFDAHCTVELEAMAQSALRQLTTDQLGALVWIGLLDVGWARVLDEIDRRGAQ